MTHLRPTARVARGATYLFVQGLVSAFIGVVYFVILTRTFPPPHEEMGVFAILSFIVSLVQVFGTFALPSAATKYIAQYLAEEKTGKARSVVARVLQICLLSSAVLFVPLFFGAESLSILFLGTSEWAPLFQVLAFTTFFTILHIEVISFLQGLQRIRDLALITLAYTLVQSFLGIYLLYLGWGLLGIVLGWLAGLMTSSIIGLIIIAMSLGLFGKPHPVKPLINFSYPLYVSGVLAYLAAWVDQLFILPFMETFYLGMYHVAVRAAIVPGLISSSILTALFPKLSELYTQHGPNSLRDAFRISTRYAVSIGFPMIIGLAVLAYPILVFFAGVEYAEAALPLSIICLAALPGTLGVAIGPTLLTLERTKALGVLTVFSILSNTFVSYITLAYLNLGMVGAAYARILASLVGTGLGVYALRRTLNVSFDMEMLWKVSVASIVMTVALILSRGLETLIFNLYLPFCVIIGATVYFFSLVALKAIKKHDVELIQDYLPKGLKKVAAWLGRIAVAE